jgi:hypothetical protein
VPTGVTSVLVEITAGGSGGIVNGGGSGGGYIMALLDVTPASSISYTVGAGGIGSTGGASTPGGHSQVVYGSTTMFAAGGLSSSFDFGTKVFSANGGSLVVSPATFRNYIGISGAAGSANQISFQQKSATSFFEISSGGHGGGPGYCRECITKGSYAAYDIAAAAYLVTHIGEFSFRALTGSGGGSGYGLTSVGGFVGGRDGADGIVIIHY